MRRGQYRKRGEGEKNLYVCVREGAIEVEEKKIESII